MFHERAGRRWPYYVDLTNTHTRAEHVAWLGTNVGGYKTLWDFSGPNRICFKNQQDQLMFVLRWT